MKTDDLITALAADSTVAPAPEIRLIWLLPALAVALTGLWVSLGLRTDLAEALLDPVSAMRIVLTLALALLALAALRRLARPGQTARLWPMLAVPVGAAALWLWAWAGVPAGGHQMAIVGKTMVYCLTAIPLMAILPTAAVLAMLRHGAPTRPALSAALSGLAGGGLAAAVYALHCTEDSPLFYVTWYGVAIAAVTGAASLIGPRLLRW